MHIIYYFYRYIVTYTVNEGPIPKIKLYLCTLCDCTTFKSKAKRDNHLRTVHKQNLGDDTTNVAADHKLKYVKASLSFNLMLRDINDAIREGDGERLLELYKK